MLYIFSQGADVICTYLFSNGSLASTYFSLAEKYVWFSGQSWIHFITLNFWRGDRWRGNALGMLWETEWESFSCPAYIPGEIFMCTARLFVQPPYPLLATAEHGEKGNFWCMFCNWYVLPLSAPWWYVQKGSGCLSSSHSYFKIDLGILYDAVSDQWDTRGNLALGQDVTLYSGGAYCCEVSRMCLMYESGIPFSNSDTNLLKIKLFLGLSCCLRYSSLHFLQKMLIISILCCLLQW